MIQNSYREMWPLLNWSNPARVGTEKDWNRFIVRPMQEGQSKDASGKEVAESRVGADSGSASFELTPFHLDVTLGTGKTFRGKFAAQILPPTVSRCRQVPWAAYLTASP